MFCLLTRCKFVFSSQDDTSPRGFSFHYEPLNLSYLEKPCRKCSPMHEVLHYMWKQTGLKKSSLLCFTSPLVTQPVVLQIELLVPAVPPNLLGPGLRRCWLPVVRPHQLQGSVHHSRPEEEPAGRRRRTSVIRLAFINPPPIVAILVSSRHSRYFRVCLKHFVSLIMSCAFKTYCLI